MARSFGQPNVAWDGGLEQLFSEKFFDIGGHLLGQVGAVVIHGQNYTFQAQLGIEGLGHPIKGTHQL